MSRADWIALALLTVGGGVLRFARLARPGDLVFDEIFYARNACWYVHASPSVCGIDGLVSRAHPPLGNWLIGAGILAAGYDSFGWRLASAIAGTVTIALVFILARRLSGSTMVACVAAGLLAVDFLHFVHSRLAMLDVFVTLFAVAAFLFAVSDLARDRRRAARDGEAQTGRGRWVSRLVLGRPWRLAAGAAAGAAIACKWSGGLVLIGVIGLTFAWELHARWTDGGGRPLHRTVRDELPSVVAWLLVAPLAVYLVSYTGRVPGSPLVPPWQEGSWLGAVLDHQAAMLGFHTGLGGHHPYESPPWSWLLLKRPVAYYFDVFEGGYQEILALGNPLVWWPSMGALAFLAIRAVRRRAAGSADLVALLGFAITLLPWVMLRGDRSQVFIFYLLPTVPFMCLALALAVQALGRSLAGRVATVAFLGAALTVFVFFYPILAALPIAPDQWRTRILFDDCATAARGVSTLPDAETASGDPPAGWCWR